MTDLPTPKHATVNMAKEILPLILYMEDDQGSQFDPLVWSLIVDLLNSLVPKVDKSQMEWKNTSDDLKFKLKSCHESVTTSTIIQTKSERALHSTSRSAAVCSMDPVRVVA